MRTFPMMVVTTGILLAVSGCGISQEERAATGGLGGAAAGAVVAGPVGAVVGGVAGATAGSVMDEGAEKKVAELTNGDDRRSGSTGRASGDRRSGSSVDLSRDEIRSLQQALNDRGHNIAVDGVWGQNTRNALREFQQSQGMDATGRPDQRTMAALNIDTGQRTGAGSSGNIQRTPDGRSDMNRDTTTTPRQ